MRGSRIYREEYGYFFVVDGEEVWGFERDPSHTPAVHEHGRGHARSQGQVAPVAFKDVVAKAWYDLETLTPDYAG